MEEFFQD